MNFIKNNKFYRVLFSIQIQNFREYSVLYEQLFEQETERFNERIMRVKNIMKKLEMNFLSLIVMIIGS